MATARIFQRPKNAMQSGKYRTDRWQLEFEPTEAKKPDPLTGWAGSGDTQEQVRLTFATLEEAIAYCQREGLDHPCRADAAKDAEAAKLRRQFSLSSERSG